MTRDSSPFAQKRILRLTIVCAATLFLLSLTPSAQAHIASGQSALTDWHWRWDVGLVLVFFAALYILGWLRLRKIGGEAKLNQLTFYAVALSAIGCASLSPPRRSGWKVLTWSH